MFRLWGKIWKDNHMLRDTVVCDDSDDTRTHKIFHGLEEICYQMDLGNPIWLDATVKDFKKHDKARFYQDKLLPLYKLYRVETALDVIQKEKVWLNSGGFLVIQQTEAFVSIDVNSGKYTGKKKMEETFRKINLEAAAEIDRQLRLRNLSGIILIDFINMENPDHRDELFHVLQKLLRKDPIKSRAIDITPLHILEMTRKKVRRPVIEDIRELTKK